MAEELKGVVLAEVESRPLEGTHGSVYVVLRYLENERHRAAFLAGRAELLEFPMFMSVNMASKLLDIVSAAGKLAADQQRENIVN